MEERSIKKIVGVPEDEKVVYHHKRFLDEKKRLVREETTSPKYNCVETYKYDDEDNLLYYSCQDNDGLFEEISEYGRRDNEDYIKRKTIDADGSESNLEWRFDENGFCKTLTRDDIKDYKTSEFSVVKNDDGTETLINESIYEKTGKKVKISEEKFDSDENGNKRLVYGIYHNLDGKYDSIVDISYDENGNIISRKSSEFCNEKDIVLANSVSETNYEYDEKNRCIKTTSTDGSFKNREFDDDDLVVKETTPYKIHIYEYIHA